MQLVLKHSLEESLDKVWFTADQHFDHVNMIDYMNRPFTSTRDMEDKLVGLWNAVIPPNNSEYTVYTLGDFSWGSQSEAIKILERLNGTIHLIPGNHDYWLRNMPSHKLVALSSVVSIELPIVTLEFSDVRNVQTVVVLSHYPLRTWDRMRHGAYHLYAHSHCWLPGIGRSIDVGIDCQDYMPISLRQVLGRLKNKMIINDREPSSRECALEEARTKS